VCHLRVISECKEGRRREECNWKSDREKSDGQACMGYFRTTGDPVLTDRAGGGEGERRRLQSLKENRDYAEIGSGSAKV